MRSIYAFKCTSCFTSFVALCALPNILHPSCSRLEEQFCYALQYCIMLIPLSACSCGRTVGSLAMKCVTVPTLQYQRSFCLRRYSLIFTASSRPHGPQQFTRARGFPRCGPLLRVCSSSTVYTSYLLKLYGCYRTFVGCSQHYGRLIFDCIRQHCWSSCTRGSLFQNVGVGWQLTVIGNHHGCSLSLVCVCSRFLSARSSLK